MEKILGLDIGIASVGHAVIEYDDTKFSGKILSSGVRVFEACEVAKTKESLNNKRRECRGARRRLSRRNNRLREIKRLFVNNNYLSEEEIYNIFYGRNKRQDIWELRKEVLNRKLTTGEFYRILHQIAKRRGFKSVRKSEEIKNDGNLLKSISENKLNFENSEFQTIGEMFATIYADEPKRNQRDEYKNSIPRELLLQEIKTIFQVQREFNLDVANENIEEEYIDIAFRQRSLQSMEQMIGYCQFEKDEKRAPKAAYTSELFVATQKLINTKYIDNNGEEKNFNKDEIAKIIELAHAQNKVTYKQIRKELNFDENTYFKNLKYIKKDQTEDSAQKHEKEVNPEDATLIELKKYTEIKKAIIKQNGELYFNNIGNKKVLFNEIARILTYEKSDESIQKEMQKYGIEQNIIDAVKNITASKVMHLSIKAMENILPYMLLGMKYNEACSEAGYDFRNQTDSNNLEFLPVLLQDDLTTNPVVNRAISQTRKVVNALLRKYGKFDRIIIETARDLGKSPEERNKIKSGQEVFQKEKDLARQRCIENGLNPDSKNTLLKFRLWEEQGGYCSYSKKLIDIKRLGEPNYVDIDHIIPYSRCYDDSLNNKVLCLSDENRQKGNKIPYEYLGGKYDWNEYSAWIRSLNLKPAKQNRLLRKTFAKDDSEGFSSRNLNDTRYIAVFIKDYIKDNLNTKVETRNGSLTAFLRNQWGITKVREENDRHHAVDAIVLACSTQGMVKYLSTVSAQRESYNFINNLKPKFKKPWETFSEDLEQAVSQIFVSRAPRNKIPGGLHKETIYSPKHLDEGFTTIKKSIKDIKLKDLENLYDKERNYNVYNTLKNRLTEFNDDPKKAFAEPVYMPLNEAKKKEGIKPHQIKSIKLVVTGTSGMLVHNGFAYNDSMPRTDVFSKKNKKGKEEFYLVPIYVSDFAKGVLPNKVVSSGKNEIFLDDTYTFKFSLFSDTLLLVNKTNNPKDSTFGYFRGTDIDSGRITLIDIDNSQNKNRYSVKSLALFKKYQVDALGNYSEVKHETRQPINFKHSKKVK